MTTAQDVVTAWTSVLKAAGEVQAYLKPGSFSSGRKNFDPLVEKQEQAHAEYVCVLADGADKQR
jgi:hypothetical protein